MGFPRVALQYLKSYTYVILLASKVKLSKRFLKFCFCFLFPSISDQRMVFEVQWIGLQLMIKTTGHRFR